MFQYHCADRLFTLKFHVLHHLTEDLGRFGCKEKLNAPQSEGCSEYVERGHHHTLQRLCSRMADIVDVIN